MDITNQETQNLVLQGNEACAKGAIRAGCRFFAGYPITPSTEIIEYLSEEMIRQNGDFIQMEDEIAAVCAILGARWGGKRAMTATSGPGYTLMQEAIGYAAVTETPAVVVNVQRGGPSTGQPTLSSQQDIYQARYGSHGDYEIIVLTPSSVQEMYDFTVRAFELSETYRTPVILLADEIVGHMREKITVTAGEPALPGGAGAGISSPQADFFTGQNTLVEGQLHDGLGRRIGHLARESGAFIQSINRKIIDHIDEITDIETYCMEDADIAFVAYGSVARPAMNAVQLARGVRDERLRSGFELFKNILKRGVGSARSASYRHLKVGLIKINTVWPFPEAKIVRLTRHVDTVVVPEMNVGKYCREIQRALPDKKVISLPRCGGEIHTPNEMLDKVLKEAGVHEQAL